MGSIERRERAGRLTWRAHYRGPDGRQRNKSFDRRREAETFLTTVESSKLSGSFVDPARSKVTVRVWSGQWQSSQGHLKPSTLDRYNGLLRCHVLPRWGRAQLTNVSHADVQAWVTRLRAEHSASTAVKAHRVLSLILALAVRDGRMVRNPADGISLPREVRKDRRYLTHVQVAALAEACANPTESVAERREHRQTGSSGDYRLAVLVLAYTGVRFGEMAALRCRRLDFAPTEVRSCRIGDRRQRAVEVGHAEGPPKPLG